jgi:hypothetical protein
VSAFNSLPPGTFPLFQDAAAGGPRGAIQFPTGGVGDGQSTIMLFERADLSTVLHETGHLFLSILQDLANRVQLAALPGSSA